MRAGTVALIGRTNTGKSTLLNAMLKEPLAITSPLPQTTRDNLLGVLTRGEAQLAFVDTPGLHRPRNELGRRMNTAAQEALRSTDVVAFVTDVSPILEARKAGSRNKPGSIRLSEEDRSLLEAIPDTTPAIAIVNKVDLIRNKALLLPLLEAVSKARPFAACLPISAKNDDGVTAVVEELVALLPERQPAYDEETLTDRPTSFFAREYVREQVLLAARGEVPHAVAVTIDRFEERKNLSVIHATIHVEKPGQRIILIGRGGERLKQVGIGARSRLERLLGHKVHLELFVRVTPHWKNTPRRLSELGYEGREEAAAPVKDGGAS